MSSAFSTLTDWVACVDVGASKIAVSLANAHGFHAKRIEATVLIGDNNAVAEQIIRMMRQGCEQLGLQTHDIAAIGISSCGPFVRQHGKIELAAPNVCGGLAGEKREAYPITGKALYWKRHCALPLGMPAFALSTTPLRHWKQNAVGALCKTMAQHWPIVLMSPGAQALAQDCAWMTIFCWVKTATRVTLGTCL